MFYKGGFNMIKIYEDFRNGRTKVCFTIKGGDVSSVIVGNRTVMTNQGFQFYVDDYVAEQIHKCELVLDGLTPKLVLKEGETLVVPTEEEEKEKEIKELEERLQRLKAE